MDSRKPLACALAGYLIPLHLNNTLFRVAIPLREKLVVDVRTCRDALFIEENA
jgi:hypothetical protein